MNFIALDFETANSTRSSICSIGLAVVENGKIIETEHILVKPTPNYYDGYNSLLKQGFQNGIEIICQVRVRFHQVYGLSLEVLQIDVAHTLGSQELGKKLTLERLIKENPKTIQLYDGVYKTYNNRLPLPLVINKIALITAPNSDGQRDFLQESKQNKHLYTFLIEEFLTTIQGENAHQLIIAQLRLIEKRKEQFDIVAIVRGGGSQTDFKPFDDYELSKYVAGFPIPIFTGIGHDRNQSIVDLMVREQKTPTKVATLIVENNFEFENKLIEAKTKFYKLVDEQVQAAKNDLENKKRIVRLASPQAIVNRGFAIVTHNNEIITDSKKIKKKSTIQTILRNETIYSTVTKKTKNENQINL